jgi:hypothetical protein
MVAIARSGRARWGAGDPVTILAIERGFDRWPPSAEVELRVNSDRVCTVLSSTHARKIL